ncbi:hypothetical protein SM19410_08405 [Xanthomonas hortorum pv. gardneri]|nr:hypothetical protein BJD10_03795 [Xanthomonas hortorum pv. gardneri]EGD16969.1 hypothetical protein XGA_4465 [Xanthomonas hortorum ATCC 19865]PPU43711.1 hypothetical protein XcyCFBP4188_10280 [Xanthomonas hortorum pv. cynarae]KLA98507.1 hypothetical protein SM19410_08405 [Xanthomonas hortorum pv. gardneri]KLB03180.1 hypothetical protein SM18210_11585 [Xanthomonas hortorum pv. gardneri]
MKAPRQLERASMPAGAGALLGASARWQGLAAFESARLSAHASGKPALSNVTTSTLLVVTQVGLDGRCSSSSRMSDNAHRTTASARRYVIPAMTAARAAVIGAT